MLLSSALDQIRFEVDSVIRREFDAQLYTLKSDDALRLLKLRVWSVRYKVSVEYILKRLVPHFKKYAANFRRRYNTKGLGVTIPVLTGRVAEEKLREFIAKDFPDGENAADWKESERNRCLAIINKDEIQGRPKPFLHHKTIKSFIDSYNSRIQSMSAEQNRLEKKMTKQPWRNNPWR